MKQIVNPFLPSHEYMLSQEFLTEEFIFMDHMIYLMGKIFA